MVLCYDHPDMDNYKILKLDISAIYIDLALILRFRNKTI